MMNGIPTQSASEPTRKRCLLCQKNAADATQTVCTGCAFGIPSKQRDLLLDGVLKLLGSNPTNKLEQCQWQLDSMRLQVMAGLWLSAAPRN